MDMFEDEAHTPLKRPEESPRRPDEFCLSSDSDGDANEIHLGMHKRNARRNGSSRFGDNSGRKMQGFDLDDGSNDKDSPTVMARSAESSNMKHALGTIFVGVGLLTVFILTTVAVRHWVVDRMTCHQIQKMFTVSCNSGQDLIFSVVSDPDKLVRNPWGFNEAPATVLLSQEDHGIFLQNAPGRGGVSRLYHNVKLAGTRLSMKERARDKRARPQIPAEYVSGEVATEFGKMKGAVMDKSATTSTTTVEPIVVSDLDQNSEEANELLLSELMEAMNRHNPFFLPKQFAVFEEHWMDGLWDFGRDGEPGAPIWQFYYWTDADVEYLVQEFGRNFEAPTVTAKGIVTQSAKDSAASGPKVVGGSESLPDLSWVPDLYHRLPTLEMKEEMAKLLILFRFGGLVAGTDTELLDPWKLEEFLRQYDNRDGVTAQEGRNIALFLGTEIRRMTSPKQEPLSTAMMFSSSKHPVWLYILNVIRARNPVINDKKVLTVSDYNHLPAEQWQYLRDEHGRLITSLDALSQRMSASRTVNAVTHGENAVIQQVNYNRYTTAKPETHVENFMAEVKSYAYVGQHAQKYSEDLPAFYSLVHSLAHSVGLSDIMFQVGTHAIVKGIELWHKDNGDENADLKAHDAKDTFALGIEGVVIPRVHMSNPESPRKFKASAAKMGIPAFEVHVVDGNDLPSTVLQHRSHSRLWQRKRSLLSVLMLVMVFWLGFGVLALLVIFCFLIKPGGMTNGKRGVIQTITGKDMEINRGEREMRGAV